MCPLLARSLLCLSRTNFFGTQDVELAFTQLKQLMTEAPVHATPNFSILFILETDAFGSTMRVFLI